MAKQESFDSIKHNKTTLFLSKFIFNGNMKILKKSGFIDSYVIDKEKEETLDVLSGKGTQKLFLLFRNEKFKLHELERIVKELAEVEIDVIYSYELINNYSMIVIGFPMEHSSDYEHVIKGEYSKLSPTYTKVFPEVRSVLNSNKVEIGKEHTIYYHIFNRTEWLENYWKARLNLIELSPTLELWPKPDKADLEFNKEILNK